MPRLKESLSKEIEELPKNASAVAPHELYMQRGSKSGSEFDDWLQAEEEIRRAQEEAIDDILAEQGPKH
jgi:hypothetical protein